MSDRVAFDDDLVRRLPLPLAQLYRRANNAKTPLDRYTSAYYLWEAAIKLLGSVAIASFAERDQRSPDLDFALEKLARPTLGDWWMLIRRLTPVLARGEDEGFRSLSEALLGRPRMDLPRAAALNAALHEVNQGARTARSSVRLSELLDRLVQYRNLEIGHGAAGQRSPEFYERMCPMLMGGAAEVLGQVDVTAGGRLIYVKDVRRRGPDGWLIEWLSLTGESPWRFEPLEITGPGIARLPIPGRVYLSFDRVAGEPSGGPKLRSLHPLTIYEPESDEYFFIDSIRSTARIRYLSYRTGSFVERTGDGADLRALWGDRTEGTESPTESSAASSEAEGPSEPGRPLEPRTIGEFELLSELGRGGMGVVYRAWQPVLGRQVALKSLYRSGDPRAEARFALEIRALSRVDHPNLVKIFTSGVEGGTYFYSMELVEGATLDEIRNAISSIDPDLTRWSKDQWREALATTCERARAAEHPLSEIEAARSGREGSPEPTGSVPSSSPVRGSWDYVRHLVGLIRQVAEAANALHDAGIIHRDIKPRNILVTSDGSQAILFDPGLAQLADDRAGRLTRTRQFVGTLRYASPEQVLALERVDRRSDVYSLGATLWELLTLRGLFGADEQPNELQLMRRITADDPEPVRKFFPGIDRDVEAIVQKCLEKNPARRFATAGELAEDLGRWLRGEPVRAQPPTFGYLLRKFVRRHKLPIATAAIVSLVSLSSSVVALTFLQREVRSLKTELRASQARVAELEANPGAFVSKSSRPSAAPPISPPAGSPPIGWIFFGALLSGVVGTHILSRLQRNRYTATAQKTGRKEAPAVVTPPIDGPARKRPATEPEAAPLAAEHPGIEPEAGAPAPAEPLEPEPGPQPIPARSPAVAPPVRPASHAGEAFSSQTVMLHYPAPIAIAYQRFYQRTGPREKLGQLYDAFEATVKYLVYLGLSDLLSCLARSDAPNPALPKHQAFDLSRKPVKMMLGLWIQCLRVTCTELMRFPEADRFFKELPEVCRPEGFLDRNIMAWIAADRNLSIHRKGGISLSDEESKPLIPEARSKLEKLFQEIHFVRRYPLGFVLPGYHPEGDPPRYRYRVHSCMGSRVRTGEEVYSIESPIRFEEDRPFVVAPDDRSIRYLWPWLVQRTSDKTLRPTLYVFEGIPEEAAPDADHGFLKVIGSAAIDHEDPWDQPLSGAKSEKHEWLWKELRNTSPTAPLAPGLDLHEGLSHSVLGTLTGETLTTSKTPHKLLEPIAKGGFGTIYHAEMQGEPPQLVAVKVLESQADQEQYARIKREFKKLEMAGALNSHIIRCYEFGNDLKGRREYPWYSMEYANGGDFDGYLQERRSRMTTKVAWDDPEIRRAIILEFRAVVGAVETLHDKQVIHRDIKPANILLVDGNPRLSDFGLVKELRDRLNARHRRSFASVTGSGGRLGTNAYMSPEQDHGRDVSFATDVYSLGIVLAELALGEWPEPKAVAAGSLIEHNAKLDHLPDELRALIVGCTDLDPARRPVNGHAVRVEFDELAAAYRSSPGPGTSGDALASS